MPYVIPLLFNVIPLLFNVIPDLIGNPHKVNLPAAGRLNSRFRGNDVV